MSVRAAAVALLVAGAVAVPATAYADTLPPAGDSLAVCTHRMTWNVRSCTFNGHTIPRPPRNTPKLPPWLMSHRAIVAYVDLWF